MFYYDCCNTVFDNWIVCDIWYTSYHLGTPASFSLYQLSYLTIKTGV